MKLQLKGHIFAVANHMHPAVGMSLDSQFQQLAATVQKVTAGMTADKSHHVVGQEDHLQASMNAYRQHSAHVKKYKESRT